jgi:hypothetical protein
VKGTNTTLQAIRGILQAQVDVLRQRGTSWADIGNVVGVSRQSAWERFAKG